MAANNDILEMFEMVGTVAVDFAQAFKVMTTLEDKAEETTSKLQDRFEKALRIIDNLSASPEIQIDSETAVKEIRGFSDQFRSMLDDLKANGSIDFDTDPAVKDLQELQKQTEEFERMYIGPEGRIEIDSEGAKQALSDIRERAQTLRETLKEQRYVLEIDATQANEALGEFGANAEQVTTSVQDQFENVFQVIDQLTAVPTIEVDSEAAVRDVREFREIFRSMLEELKADASIDFDTDPAVKELQELQRQAEALENSFIGPEGTIELDAVAARETLAEIQTRALLLRETLQDQRYSVKVEGNQAQSVLRQILTLATDMDGALNRLRDRAIRIERFIVENVNRVIQTTYANAGDPGVVGPQVTPSGQPQSNGPPPADDPDAYLGATTAALGALGASGAYAARGANRFTYDLERADRALQSYHQRMLRYAEQLNPQTALKRATVRLDVASDMFQYFPNSKNMLMLQATFSAIEQGALAARKQLSQLGFGRTKTEIKGIEAQMHTMANIRLDNLHDQIKLTEQALKDMKASANADEFVEEMAEAERALKRYKDELARANPVDVIAKANGYKAGKLFGKDVIYKPFDNAMDALAGRIKQFTNRDLAYLQNKTYEALDNAAKAIVGKQTTKAEEKVKINALAMKYQQLGMMLNTFVTPAVAALAIAFGAVANAAQKGWGKFEAQTLSASEDMKDFKNLMADTSADTGTSIEEVGELFSVLHNQMGRTKENIKESAEWGLKFKEAWGTDAVEAISAVDNIAKELGVTQKEATDILALAMKKHQGDLAKATKDVYKNEDAWRKNGKTMVDGMTAYEKMVSGLDDNGVAKTERAFRKLGTSLLELWKALEPTVVKLADALSAAADTATEFLRNNPGMATFLAHMIAIGGASLVLIGALAPIAGFLIMNRGLFQALGQALGFAGKGMVVMSPQARMLYDNLILTRNAVAGLPRMFRALGPGILSALRGLPGLVGGFLVQFVKMNPILSTIAALSWVIYKNWDKFEPVLSRIWDSIKRIGNVIIEAFAGPGQTGAEGFGKMMDKLAYILGEVLLPLFEVLATVLEGVAALMETGAGKYIVYAVAIGMMTGALGKMIPGLGLLSSAFGLLTGKAGKAGGAIGALKSIFSGVGGAAGKMGPMIGRALGGVGGVLARFGTALLPLLTNPWVLGIAAVVAVVAGLGYLIYKNWDDIVAGTKRIFGGIATWFRNHWQTILVGALGPIGLLGKLLVDNWDSLATGAKKGAKKIGSWFKTGLSGIGSAFSGLGPKLRRGFSNMWSDFKGNVSKNLRELNKTWSWQFNNLWKALGPVGKFLKTAFTGIFKGFPILAARYMQQVVSGTVRRLRLLATGITNGLKLAAKAFSTGWGMAKRATSAAFSAISRTVKNSMASARRGISDAFATIRRIFSNATAFLRRVVSEAFSAIRRTITNVMAATSRTLSGALSRIRKIFSDALATIRRLVSSGFSAIRRIATDAMNSLSKTLSNILSRIRRLFSDAVSYLRKRVSEGFAAIRRAVSSAMSSISRVISDVLGKVRRAFSSAMSYIARTARDAFRSVYNSVKSNIGRAWSSITNTFGRIKNYFSDLARKALSWGGDVVGGIVRGMTSKARHALDTVRDLAGDISSAFKKAMGIASPSKVMIALARWIPVGVAGGIEDGRGEVEGATDNLVKAATGDFSGAARIDVMPEFTGDPTALATRMMAGAIGTGVDLDAQINSAARLQVDQTSQPQIIQVKEMPVHVHVNKLADQNDFNELGKQVQRVIVDNTNNEVNRMG